MVQGYAAAGDLPFLQAAALLPTRLRQGAERLPLRQQRQVEEFRLRGGRAMTLVYPTGEERLPGCDGAVERQELERVLEIATHGSAHSALEHIRNGFVTVQGGHRIGVCASVVLKDGTVHNLREISSLCIRIARSVPGIAAAVLDELMEAGELQSTLILSPPGGGKTTLLRDLIRSISDGVGTEPRRVGVADERGELAAMENGIAQLDVGMQTDVMDGCPKAPALMMLLRGMNPQVLAVDEITAPEDCAALEMAANCGVTLLATAHGSGMEDLMGRKLYRGLLEKNIFQRVVTISQVGAHRRYETRKLERRNDEVDRGGTAAGRYGGAGVFSGRAVAAESGSPKCLC